MNNLLEKLREPFSKDELEFRVGATNSDKTMGLALAYVQARAIQNRLDDLFGVNGWTTRYKEVGAGFICSLSVKINDEWITKEDGAPMTDFESIKGGISNAFKRVASSGFGIGRYLYNAKNNWFPIKQQGKGYIFVDEPTLELSENKSKERRIETTENKVEENPYRIIINFGKYKGLTLDEIYRRDIKYIKYLKDKAQDKNIAQACATLIA